MGIKRLILDRNNLKVFKFEENIDISLKDNSNCSSELMFILSNENIKETNIHIKLEHETNLRLFVLVTYNTKGRSIKDKKNINITLNLLHENARGEVFLAGKYHSNSDTDINIVINNRKKNTKGYYRGINFLYDSSHIFTKGLINIFQFANKSDSYFKDNNVLLSPKTIAKTSPILEIKADDVKASHGATIGMLDESQIFYLESRGFERKDINDILIDGLLKKNFTEYMSDELYNLFKDNISN